MKIQKLNEKYIFQCTYEERELPKKIGFRWNSVTRQWETTHPAVVLTAIQQGIETVDINIEDLKEASCKNEQQIEKARNGELSWSEMSSLNLPRTCHWNSNNIEIRTSYDDDINDALWKKFRAQWDKNVKARIIKVEKIIEVSNFCSSQDFFFSSEFSAELNLRKTQQEISIKASQSVDADIDIPRPQGLEYLPFQKAGIQYAYTRANTLIADEMGLGKTIQAIGVINLDISLRKILIICPASLRLNWKRELEKWLVNKYSIEIANSQFPDSDIVIINYDILKKYDEKIKAIQWDMLICDESHYLKSHDAQRTQLVLGKKKDIAPISARRKLFLTGTPILNRPIELWPIVNAIAPHQFPSWYDYVTKYCNGYQTRWGWDVSGASNLEELQTKLRSTIMVRRLKKDVLTELPPKRRQIIELPANGAQNQIRQEIEAYKQYHETIAILRQRVEKAKANETVEEYEKAVQELRTKTQLMFTEISKLRHETAVAKIPQVVAHIQDVLEQQDKVIVFAHHHDIIEAIRTEFADCSVTLTGDTSAEDRQKAVDAFQTDEKVKLFIGSIRASGVGITLTASSHIIFAELDWTPANITQAEDRAHRIGQQNSVLVQHLVLEGSLDANMARMLIEKQNIIDKALNKELVSTVDITLPNIEIGNSFIP